MIRRQGPAGTRRPATVAALPMLFAVALAGCGDAGDDEPVYDPASDLIWPFPAVAVASAAPVLILVLWDTETPDGSGGVGDAPGFAAIDWTVTHLGKDAMGWYTTSAGDELGGMATTAAGPGPRFGRDGHNATRVTLFAFNDAAELIGHNAELQEYAHLPWVSGNPIVIEDATYYFGDDDPPPEGTKRLPAAMRSFEPRIRDLLDGLPEDGVAAVKVTRAEHGVPFFGDVYLTARIDALVHAP